MANVDRNPSTLSASAMRSIQKFVEKLTDADLHARHVSTKSAYLQRYNTNIFHRRELQWTLVESTRMSRLLHEVDTMTRDTFLSSVRIPWKLVLVEDEIENGLTHTQGDTIFLSRKELLSQPDSWVVKTLIHEKVHILQRILPEWAESVTGLLMQYVRVDVPWSSQQIHTRRANPDLNEYHYAVRGVFVPIMMYRSLTPQNLHDASVQYVSIDGSPWLHESNRMYDVTLSGIWKDVHQIEHPYEVMACIIANAFIKRSNHSHIFPIESKLLASLSSTNKIMSNQPSYITLPSTA